LRPVRKTGLIFHEWRKKVVEDLRAEMPVLNFLRLVFLAEPKKELLEGISQMVLDTEEEGMEGLRLIHQSVKRNEGRLDDWMEELSVEFARLFLGPVHPPAIPYASFYLSDMPLLMTEETLEVRKKYLEAGFALKELYRIPDDHISFELEFVFYLTREIIASSEQGKTEDAERLYRARDEFLREHMSSWVLPFANRVLEHTSEDFYKGAAIMLRQFVETSV
jgi:TorA maturation chaperone TorD